MSISRQGTPQRVVSLQPSVTLILESLGLLERVVAATRHCLAVCPAIAGRVLVEDSWTAQAEQIRGARPDMVIAAVPYQMEAVAEILKSGARVLLLAPRKLADIYGDITTIAKLFDTAERGRQVISEMQAGIAAVSKRAQSAASRPRVFCEEWGKPIRHSQPWVAELVEAAGGEFLGTPASAATAEEIAAADPDALVFAWCGAGDRVPLAKVISERGWSKLRAVQQRRVYCIRDELLTTPAPILLDGLRALAAAIHPGLFPAAPGLRQLQ